MSWLLAAAKLRVPRVPQGITEAVEPEHAMLMARPGKMASHGACSMSARPVLLSMSP
jgi:hypothetical protein